MHAWRVIRVVGKGTVLRKDDEAGEKILDR